MPAKNLGWEKFTKRISINADPQTVYNAWCARAGIESWFLRESVFSRSGTSLYYNEQIKESNIYSWRWFGYGDDVTEHGRILAANGEDMFQFTFTGNYTVTVRIYKEDNETIAELTQENIRADNNPETNLYVCCGEGWTFYLANLKSVLEGGLYLRNKNTNLKRVVNS